MSTPGMRLLSTQVRSNEEKKKKGYLQSPRHTSFVSEENALFRVVLEGLRGGKKRKTQLGGPASHAPGRKKIRTRSELHGCSRRRELEESGSLTEVKLAREKGKRDRAVVRFSWDREK